MSVRKGDRGEGELDVINASRELLSYTYDRVRDTNIFPKSDRWLLAKSIWDCASGARTRIVRANAVRVESKADAELRISLEKEAVGYLDALETLIDLANIKGLISGDRMEFWEGLLVKTLKPLRGWLKADRERYRTFLK